MLYPLVGYPRMGYDAAEDSRRGSEELLPTGRPTMATILMFLTMATLGIGGLMVWAELQAHLGPHSAFGLAGGLLLILIGGLAAWRFGRGQNAEGTRWTFLAIAAALALLAIEQWPGVREARFREAAIAAEMRLEASRGTNPEPTWLSELERDVALWAAQQRHDRVLADAGNDFRYARGVLAFLLSLVWLGAAFASERVHAALTT